MTEEQYHVHDLLAAYVLGAVTPAEAALVEEHLATCALCRGQAGEFSQIERALPALAGELAPPPALKARLMSIVEAEARTRNGRTTTAGGINGANGTNRTDGAVDASDWSTPARLTPLPVSSARAASGQAEGRRVAARRRGMPLGPVLALAAALALVALGLGLWRAINGASRPTSVYAVKAPRGTNYGTLAYYRDGHRLVLDLRGLKKTDSAHVYELWLIRLSGGKPVAVKGVDVFRAPDGTGRLVKDGQDIHGYNAAGLTVEQRFSPTTPTLPVVALASIVQPG